MTEDVAKMELQDREEALHKRNVNTEALRAAKCGAAKQPATGRLFVFLKPKIDVLQWIECG